jgi:hypothetical protein
MTKTKLDQASGSPFPVLVMSERGPKVIPIHDLRVIPPLSRGETYLVPPEKIHEVSQYLAQQRGQLRDGRWELVVRSVATNRQDIELYWVSDGYSGGGYEATESTITPKYRKITGPGFGIICAGMAILMNVLLWSPAALLWLFKRTPRVSNMSAKMK